MRSWVLNGPRLRVFRQYPEEGGRADSSHVYLPGFGVIVTGAEQPSLLSVGSIRQSVHHLAPAALLRRFLRRGCLGFDAVGCGGAEVVGARRPIQEGDVSRIVSAGHARDCPGLRPIGLGALLFADMLDVWNAVVCGTGMRVPACPLITPGPGRGRFDR